MAAAVEELTVSINHVSDRASEANTLVVNAGKMARDGAATIGQTLADIRHIETAVKDAAEIVSRLDEGSTKVNAVVAVIKEVANQTNLLALNAAIEAARAGEICRRSPDQGSTASFSGGRGGCGRLMT